MEQQLAGIIDALKQAALGSLTISPTVLGVVVLMIVFEAARPGRS
jgi:hypothetical protein